MAAKDLGKRLILFQFYKSVDLRRVFDAGPWLFDRFLFVLHQQQPREQGSRNRDLNRKILRFYDFTVRIRS